MTKKKYVPVVLAGSTGGNVVVVADDDRSLISGSIEIAYEGAIDVIC